MSGYTYEVADSYNCFGAGHNYCLTLFRNGRKVDRWYFDSILGIGGALLKRKIRNLERIYGARRA